jgi:hypothetical protein
MPLESIEDGYLCADENNAQCSEDPKCKGVMQTRHTAKVDSEQTSYSVSAEMGHSISYVWRARYVQDSSNESIEETSSVIRGR